MNPFQFLRNPMQGLLQAQMQKMQQSNPELYAKGMQMIRGKTDAQLREIANNIAHEQGIDLKDFASSLGIKM